MYKRLSPPPVAFGLAQHNTTRAAQGDIIASDAHKHDVGGGSSGGGCLSRSLSTFVFTRTCACLESSSSVCVSSHVCYCAQFSITI